jgi:hypothetical protein
MELQLLEFSRELNFSTKIHLIFSFLFKNKDKYLHDIVELL